MKKLFSLFVALTLATTLVASDIQVDGIWYDFNDTKLTASVTYRGSDYYNYDNEYTGSVVIPASVSYNSKTYSVTTIGDYAFGGCSGLTSVTIPNSVTTIGNSAFEYCTGLTSVTIPNSVTTIGYRAFYNCGGLTSVIIPNSVTTIGDYAFCDCFGLTSVTIPNSVTTIGNLAFDGCSGLASITIPSSVTTIGNYAFRDCISLTSVTIPNSVTTIGNEAFGLVNNIVYNGTATGSPWGAKCVNGYVDGYFVYSDASKTKLCGCFTNAIGEIVIPNSVTTIGDYAFRDCISLTSVTIPNSVTTIGEGAFYECYNLTSVMIPSSVTTIGEWAFGEVNNIVYSGTATWGSYDEYWGAKCMNGYVDGYFVYGDATKTKLCGCFTNTTGAITIPSSVTTIGDFAFYHCFGLTSVMIPSSVTTIGKYAFYNCSGLTSITIPNSVTTIGYSAFGGCSSLTSVTIPNSVTTIGYYAFEDCSGLTSVTINSNAICNKTYTYTFNIGSIFGSQVKEYIIGDSVTTIGKYAFYNCSGLTSVTIPSSVTTIGDYAFEDCRGLISIDVDIANTHYTSVDGVLFNYAKDILIQYPVGNTQTTYFIPSSVKTIENYAFKYCSSLTSITIPSSVTTIGDDAFYNCSGLIKTNYTGTIADWCKIKFGDNRSNPMCYSHNFYINDVEVKDLIVPEGVDTIRNYAFRDCISLTSVTIPNSVTTIGEGAFEYCRGLTSVTCYATTPPTCSSSCFSAVSKSIPVYVPARSVTAYTNANAWKDFYYLQGNPNDYAIVTCSATNGTIKGGGKYIKNDECIITATANDGYYFVQWSDGNTDNPRSFVLTHDTAFTAEFAKNSYSFEVKANDNKRGSVEGTNGIYEYQTSLTMSATARIDLGYHFAQWSDGNKQNPRTLTLTQDTVIVAQFDENKCGDNLTWKYNDGILVISGTGAMYDYTQGTAPWTLFQDSISSLVINNGCTSIGNFAFYGLSNKNLKTIDIPNSVEQIGQYAFANCEYVKNLYLGLSLEKIAANAFTNDERLLYITCYAIEPPLLDESAFVNYDIYVSVPCESLADYKVAKGWKKFNKENMLCIGAEQQSVTSDEVTVVPSDNQATLTWPADDQAAGYSIEITKDGVVFCTLKFNAQGQLTGIAFAPSRGGQAREMASAEMTANGWQFTVTGLTQASKYNYTIDAINASQQSIKHYEGEFITTGGIITDLYTLPYEGKDGIGSTKFIRNNQLFIRHNGNLYNALGGKVR